MGIWYSSGVKTPFSKKGNSASVKKEQFVLWNWKKKKKSLKKLSKKYQTTRITLATLGNGWIGCRVENLVELNLKLKLKI